MSPAALDTTLKPALSWTQARQGKTPKTTSCVCVPTKTLPFTTVGTVNFTPSGILSRVPAWELLYSSCEMSPASNACRTAGAVPAPTSIAHRIPLLFPFAEIEGVEPGQLNVFFDLATGEVDSNPLDN